MSRISIRPSSPLSGNASCRTIFAPLYCFGLCEAVICDAAVALIPRDGEVHHVGRNHAVVHDIGALQRRPVDERRGERRRGQPHVAADGDLPGLQVRDEAASDRPGGLLVYLIRVSTADVVGFEDRGVEGHWDTGQ